MKRFRLLLCFYLIIQVTSLHSQPTLIAPSDIVLSCTYSIDMIVLSDYTNSTFGKVVINSSDRKELKTLDKVCEFYCIKNNKTSYPGYESGKLTVANKACDNYNSLFDANYPEKKYELVWGQDGVVSSSKNVSLTVRIKDMRICGQGLIMRIFKAIDSDGSVEAIQNIWVVNCHPITHDENHCNDTLISDIIWPIGVCGNEFALLNGCSGGFTPSNPVLGKPRIVPGRELSCSNIAMNYEDNIFTNNSDACIKILRKWTVIDWCQYDRNIPEIGIWSATQVIKIIDTEGPLILFPDSVTVNSTSTNCLGIWKVPAPWIIDNCSNTNNYSIESNIGILTGNEVNGFQINNLPRGRHMITIIAKDQCNNITKKVTTLIVTLQNAPTVDCIKSINTNINATLDIMSSAITIVANKLTIINQDTCTNTYVKVIRKDQLGDTKDGTKIDQPNVCSSLSGDDDNSILGNQIYFDDFTKICCNDIGKKVNLVLRVFYKDPGSGSINPLRMNNSNGDLYDTFSDCIVEVVVGISNVPTVVAPPNIVVSCNFKFDTSQLLNLNDPTFGRIVTELTARKKVVTQDIVCHKYCERNLRSQYPGFVKTNIVPKPAPNQACDYYNQYFDTTLKNKTFELVWGFDGYVIGDCGFNTTIKINDLRECGLGQIQRVITTNGPNNSKVSAIQTIWIVDCEPFTFTAPKGKSFNIIGCGGDWGIDRRKDLIIDTNNLDCTLLSIEYKDEFFTANTTSPCLQINRTWTIIDWCQYDPFLSLSFGRWQLTDTIFVTDTSKPTLQIEIGSCSSIDSISVPGQKFQFLDIINFVKDNCSPSDWISLEYMIDLNSDGSNDLHVGPLSSKEFSAGKIPVNKNNPFAINKNNPHDASGNYPLGKHIITLISKDGCGNIGSKTFNIEMNVDTKKPKVKCNSDVITVVMPNTQCIDIWAKDLDKGSSDNCTPISELRFYYNDHKSSLFAKLCCSDFKKGFSQFDTTLTIWVEDNASNRDSCSAKITIQDPVNHCGFVSTKNNNLNNHIKIFPNPTSGNLLLETVGNDISILEIRIYDIYGNLISIISNKDLSFTTNNQIDIAYLKSGIYNFNIVTNRGMLTNKIVKTN